MEFIEREDKVLEILSKYDINFDDYFNVKRCTNTYSYHNIHHINSFIINMYHSFNKIKIDKSIQKLLILASLFHDADYIGNKDDNQNIENSIKYFKNNIKTELSESDKKYIRLLILSTLNDYSNNYWILEDVKYSGLMQDVDLMTNFEDDSSLFRQGLSLELGVPITLESTIQFLESYEVKMNELKEYYNLNIKKLKS